MGCSHQAAALPPHPNTNKQMKHKKIIFLPIKGTASMVVKKLPVLTTNLIIKELIEYVKE